MLVTPDLCHIWCIFLYNRRQSEWEVSKTLPRVKGLRSMYHSVNTLYVLVSTDGESEDLKPVEKALRSEEVTILSNYVFFQKVK